MIATEQGEMLPAELRAAARRSARSRHLLVCSDFDGTLAPIVTDPAAARALPEGTAALLALAELPETTVAVISGRALQDLAILTGLPDTIRLVGSHGAEFDTGVITALDAPAVRLRTVLLQQVRDLTDGVPGVQLEEKPASVAVHVRRASRPDAESVLAALRGGPAQAPGVYATAGHEVLELAVVDSGKGHAIDVLRHECGATAVVFVGDDVTDEHAFARLSDSDLAVKVGPAPSVATFRVPDPAAVARLLALLAAERSAQGWLRQT